MYRVSSALIYKLNMETLIEQEERRLISENSTVIELERFDTQAERLLKQFCQATSFIAFGNTDYHNSILKKL